MLRRLGDRRSSKVNGSVRASRVSIKMRQMIGMIVESDESDGGNSRRYQAKHKPNSKNPKDNNNGNNRG